MKTRRSLSPAILFAAALAPVCAVIAYAHFRGEDEIRQESADRAPAPRPPSPAADQGAFSPSPPAPEAPRPQFEISGVLTSPSPAPFHPEVLISPSDGTAPDGAEQKWTTAPLISSEEGSARFGPLVLTSPGPRRLIAWQTDGHYFWELLEPQPADAPSPAEFRFSTPAPPTGLAVTVAGDFLNEGQYVLRVEEEATSIPEADVPLRLVRRSIAPLLAEAVELGGPLVVHPGEQVPLLPFSAPRLTLAFSTVAGRPAMPLSVPLQPGQVLPLTINPADLFEGLSSETVTLRGTLLQRPDDLPASGAVVERLESPLSGKQTVGRDGRFQFSGLPVGQTSWFRVTSPPEVADEGAGHVQEFEVEPHRQSEDGTMEVTWRVERAMVVVAPMPAMCRGLSSLPYPVYHLQKHEETGSRWREAAAPVRTSPGQELITAIREPGRFRFLAACSPLEVYFTDAVEVTGNSKRHAARWEKDGVPADLTLRCRCEADGSPLARARVAIQSPWPLPPGEVSTDHQGRVRLGRVTVGKAFLTASCPGEQARTKEVEFPPGGGVVEVFF